MVNIYLRTCLHVAYCVHPKDSRLASLYFETQPCCKALWGGGLETCSCDCQQQQASPRRRANRLTPCSPRSAECCTGWWRGDGVNLFT